MIITVEFLVQGRVQGVGFRYWTQGTAEKLGLTGWVRNCANGDVEGVAQGSASAVQRFSELLWQGPHYAKVRSVETHDKSLGRFEGFRIVR